MRTFSLKGGLEDGGCKFAQTARTIGKLRPGKGGGWIIATQSSRDFIDDALHYDCDAIVLEDVKLIDRLGAIKRSHLASPGGNLILTVYDNGSFHLRQLP